MPQLKQVFTVNHPPALVWSQFQDLPNIVQCIPGAALTEQASPTQAKGRMTVKLGPVKADFGGEVEIEADESAHTGKIIGSGIDKSHNSRAKGNVVYRLEEAKGGAATVVNVDVDYTLSGSLAQFARGGIVDAVAEQICKEFALNLEQQLNASPSPSTASSDTASDKVADAAPAAAHVANKPNELNALKLIMAIIRSKLKGLFGRKSA
ncbi:SRPBCC family protein [Aquamicrobium segne]|uniref:SRPBCC family protein n=1 Tax=Aquamicrobium segne TaxID=469547 RepID=A0ABW0GT54_9HYPH